MRTADEPQRSRLTPQQIGFAEVLGEVLARVWLAGREGRASTPTDSLASAALRPTDRNSQS